MNTECITPVHHVFDKDGYPRVKYNKRSQTVARVIYQLLYGVIPPGRLICHHCDNPGCVNPTHLYLGTHETNNKDKVMRNRVAGEKNPNARWSNADIMEMMNLYDNGFTQQAIAGSFGITQGRVSECIKRARKIVKDESHRTNSKTT